MDHLFTYLLTYAAAVVHYVHYISSFILNIGKKVHFCSVYFVCFLKNSKQDIHSHQKYVRFPGRIPKGTGVMLRG